MSKNAKTGKAAGAFLGSRINGFTRHPAKAITVSGKVIPKHVLLGKLVAIKQLVDRSDKLEVQYAEALRKRDAALEANAELLQDIDPSIRTLVGRDAEALDAFGLAAPKKRAALSAADRLIATERSNTTRKSLGTRGKRQRQELLDKLQGKPEVKVVGAQEPQPVQEPAGTSGATEPAPAPSSSAAPAPAANDALGTVSPAAESVN